MVEATDVAADWNVIVTLPEATFREARKFLRRWGGVHRTGYFHVLTLTVEDVESFLAEVAKVVEEKPGTFNILSHIIPAQRIFTFASAEKFEARARDIAILWAPMLAGKSFHVRLHRRGFKGTLSTPKEERFLDETLLDALETLGTSGRISFTDPDAIWQIGTIDGRAGVSLWQRDDLQRYPFLGVSCGRPTRSRGPWTC
jgi:tRNA(Ser,Leu) C12 N-acetylase TAN1